MAGGIPYLKRKFHGRVGASVNRMVNFQVFLGAIVGLVPVIPQTMDLHLGAGVGIHPQGWRPVHKRGAGQLVGNAADKRRFKFIERVPPVDSVPRLRESKNHFNLPHGRGTAVMDAGV